MQATAQALVSKTKTQLHNVDAAPPAGWLTAGEAAEILAITPRSVCRRCAAGKLDGRRFGGLWYVNPDSTPAMRIVTGRHGPALAAAGTPLAGLSESKRVAVSQKYQAVRDYQAARDHKPADMSLPDWEAIYIDSYNHLHPEQAVTRRTLLRWVRRFAAEGAAGLVDRRDYHGPASISNEALDFILGLYCTQHKPNLAAIYERAEAIAAAEGWMLPSLRTVQRIVRERVDRKLVTLGREPRKYRDRCVPMAVRDWSRVWANQLWVADHRQLDVWVPRRIKGGEIAFHRPWLTLFLDARTWMPVAWQIAFDAPNAQRVMQTFIAGVNLHGCPEVLYLDNGKDFRAERFAGGRPKKHKKMFREKRVTPLLEMLGVTAKWALPYNARAKIVENYFHIMAERFDKTWDTYCGNKPDNRPERLKGEQAADLIETVNLQVIQTAFDEWITGDYSLRESPAPSCKPRSALAAFRELRPADYIERRPPAEELAILLMPSKPAQVKPNGVWVGPLMRYYMSESMISGKLEYLRCGRQRVTYRYNEHDPSQVWLFDEADRFLAVAAPYIGNGIHPLAAEAGVSEDGVDETAPLVEVMAMRNGQSKRDRRRLKELRTNAGRVLGNALLSSQAAAARQLGRLDEAAATQGPARARVVIPMLAGGELSRAATEGRRHKAAAAKRNKGRMQINDLLLSNSQLRATGADAIDSDRQADDPLSLLASNKGYDNDKATNAAG